MPSDHTHSHDELRLMLLVIGLGFVVRLFSFHYTAMMNPDGTLYIHQARAIHYGLWDAVNTCNLRYLSIYSILIAGTYQIVGDWIMAGKIISLTFGTLTLVPLYLLAQRFFDGMISALVTLIFALTPIFIDRSADIVRDPVYWFFLMLGLYLFVIQLDRYRPLLLILSCCAFLVATWARIEAIVYIPVTIFFILLAVRDRKLQRLLVFCSPLIVILCLVIIGQILQGGDSIRYFRFSDIPMKLHASFAHYEDLRSQLRELGTTPPLGIRPEFFDNVRAILWFVGLGAILQHAMEAFFYPFFAFFIIGLIVGCRTIRKDIRTLYLFVLSVAALVLLYMYIFTGWAMENRYFALLIYPSCIFMAHGLEKTMLFLKARFAWRNYVVYTLLVALILAFGLGKNLKAREEDKLVFRHIGEFIAQADATERERNVLTTDHSKVWISFFANLPLDGAPCPDKYHHWQRLIGIDYETFLRTLRKHDVHYFVWVEKRWPRDRFDFLANRRSEDFRQMHSWHHWDTGRIILFQVLPGIGGKS